MCPFRFFFSSLLLSFLCYRHSHYISSTWKQTNQNYRQVILFVVRCVYLPFLYVILLLFSFSVDTDANQADENILKSVWQWRTYKWRSPFALDIQIFYELIIVQNDVTASMPHFSLTPSLFRKYFFSLFFLSIEHKFI